MFSIFKLVIGLVHYVCYEPNYYWKKTVTHQKSDYNATPQIDNLQELLQESYRSL